MRITRALRLLLRAFSRATDPETSHDAAGSLEEETLNGLNGKIVTALRIAGARGMNTSEIALVIGSPRDSVSPRLPWLQTNGYIRETDETRPGPTGRKQRVWMATGVEYVVA